MADYTKGIKIKTINGKYGEFMTVGINIEEFKSNPVNERGYVNFRLTKSRAGEWYAVNDEPQNAEQTNSQAENIAQARPIKEKRSVARSSSSYSVDVDDFDDRDLGMEDDFDNYTPYNTNEENYDDGSSSYDENEYYYN